MLLSIYNHLTGLRSRYARDKRGTTAIEFAIVIGPFLALLFGQVSVGLFFFSTFSTEHAVKEVSRQVRTGEAFSTGKTIPNIKSEICSKAPLLINCDNNMRLMLVIEDRFSDISIPSCLDQNGDLIPPSTTGGGGITSGGSDKVALVISCYEWTVSSIVPFLKLGNMSNGSTLIQAVEVFRIEAFD